MISSAAARDSSSALRGVAEHVVRIYLFSHSGHGLPARRSGFVTLFALFCFAVSLLCQSLVIWSQPDNFAHWPASELISAVLILYLPGFVGYFAQRPENTFSLCLLYLVFSVSGALGALLMPLAGSVAAILSLLLAAWAILAYLVFTPSCRHD